MTATAQFGELTGDYLIDPAHTRIGFVARHTMATRVRGRFEEFEGGAHLDGADPSRSSVRLTIQAKSIQTHLAQRDDLLRGKFLDAAAHPVLTFTSTGVQQADGNRFHVTGDLAIRGVVKPVTLDLALSGGERDPDGDFRIDFKGGVTINRRDWGANWNVSTTALVSAKVLLEFEVSVVRRS